MDSQVGVKAKAAGGGLAGWMSLAGRYAFWFAFVYHHFVFHLACRLSIKPACPLLFVSRKAHVC